jgi:hypothetical protein
MPPPLLAARLLARYLRFAGLTLVINDGTNGDRIPIQEDITIGNKNSLLTFIHRTD